MSEVKGCFCRQPDCLNQKAKVFCPNCYQQMIFSHTVQKELEEHLRRGEVYVCKSCLITRYCESGDYKDFMEDEMIEDEN